MAKKAKNIRTMKELTEKLEKELKDKEISKKEFDDTLKKLLNVSDKKTKKTKKKDN